MKEELLKQLEWSEETIRMCEKQGKLYTKEEAKLERKKYNDVFNEGGEGYVPHFYTVDEYEFAKKRTEDIQRKLKEMES